MKPFSPELQALWGTRQWYQADLYTFTLANGMVLRYTSGDANIVANSQLYLCGGFTGPYFDRADNKAKYHQKIGTASDQVIFDCIPASAAINGIPFLTCVREGIFDGAIFTLERCYMPIYGDASRGTLILFSGRIAEVDGSKTVICFTANTKMELLNLQWPRNFFQVDCVNNLGDSYCLINVENFKTTGTIGTGSNNTLFHASIVGTFPGGTFDQGTIKFTSGVLSGQSYTVRQVTYGTPNLIQLVGFIPGTPANGDTFNLYYGCDKSSGLPIQAVCDTQTGSTILSAVFPISEVEVGATVTGPNFQSGTTVVSVIDTTVNISKPATATTTTTDGANVQFSRVTNNGCGKFSNLIHFRGFEFIPQPIAAV